MKVGDIVVQRSVMRGGQRYIRVTRMYRCLSKEGKRGWINLFEGVLIADKYDWPYAVGIEVKHHRSALYRVHKTAEEFVAEKMMAENSRSPS